MVPVKRAAFFFLILLAAGCNYPSTPPAPTVDLVGTAVSATLAADGIPTQQPPTAGLLPQPVYYLSEASGSPQVWRLEADGTTQNQITDEAEPIDGFDVSRVDGSVAYVTDNQLYLVNADGSNKRLLVDNAAANPEADAYLYRQRISDPRFSPDGRYLAYAFDGVWILDLTTLQAAQLVMNRTEENDEGAIFAEALYSPLAWAPDSAQLLVNVKGFESSTLAVLNPGAEPSITEFEEPGGIICCQAAWAPDSGSVLVGSPYIGLIEPGLWRYADSGEMTELIGVGEGGLFQFVGWPLQLADGSLRYFYTSSTEIPAADLPLYMMRSDADGAANRAELRPDSFSNIVEVLWAEDGALALIVQMNSPGTTSGSLLLVSADGSPLQILLPEAQQLHWGP